MQQQMEAALPVLRRLAAAGPDVHAAAGAAARVESLARALQQHVPDSPQQLTALVAALAGALRSALGALLADWPATERHLLLQRESQPDAVLHQAACVTVANLCFALASCACAQHSGRSTASDGSPQAGGAALLVRLVLAPSGLLPLLTQAAAAAAGSLEQCIDAGSSSPQLQRAVSVCLAGLGVSLVQLWRSCMPLLDPSRQPEQRLEVMQHSAVPVAHLALALLRAAAADGSRSISSNVQVAQAVPDALAACELVASAVEDSESAASRAGTQELGASGGNAAHAALAAVRQACTHPTVLQAVAVAVAAAPLRLRHSAAAEAASAASAATEGAASLQRRHQGLAAVPAHSSALLAALGLPGLEALAEPYLPQGWAAAVAASCSVLGGLCAVLTQWAEAGSTMVADGSASGASASASSGGSSSSSGSGNDGSGSGDSGSGSRSSSGSGGSGGNSSRCEALPPHVLPLLAFGALEAVTLAALGVAAAGGVQASSFADIDGVVSNGLVCVCNLVWELQTAAAALDTGSLQPPAGPGSDAVPPSWAGDAPQQRHEQQQQLDASLASLCREVMLVLVPAVQRACSAAQQQTPELAAAWEDDLSRALRQALCGAMLSQRAAALHEAVLQQPLSSVAALEAALRQGATGGESGSRLARCSGVISWAVGNSGPVLSAEPDTWGQLDALAAAAAADPGGLGKRLFALLLSCVKAARPALATADSSSLAVSALCGVAWAAMKQGGPQLLAATASALQAAEDCAACPATEQAACSAGDQLSTHASSSGDGSSSSSSGGGGGWPHSLLRAPLMPWLVLVVRCLEAAAWWCQLPAELTPQQEQHEAGQLVVATQVLASWCPRAMVWLGLGLQQLVPLCHAAQGEAQAAAGAAEQRVALEQLLAQQEQLQASLELAVDSDGSSMPPFDAPLAAQLQAFAVGVVRELPLRLCCNSPACTSMRCTSELLLVGGKACICAGCGIEAARYCSRDCQASHWKQHRRACKRLAAVQGALID